jgi:sugar lactone lactonase YvrE/outer membrane protein assembly factor BamB
MVAPLWGQAAWPQFRGSDARGIAPSGAPPDRWSTTENVDWKTDIPGRGWSSPIVANDRVFLTTVVNLGESEEPKKGLYFGGDRPAPPDSLHRWQVICLDLSSGRIVWTQTVHEGKPQSSIHLKNSFASETPVTDGERVYAYFGNRGIYGFDLDGQLLWSNALEPHATRFGWGTAASPVLHGERIYLVNDNDEDSYLLALDKRTGQQIWRVPRDEKSNWSTPYVWQNSLRTEIVTLGSGSVRSYDLDGNVLWTLQGMSSITIATPYANGDLLYFSSGYVLDNLRPLYAVRAGGTGDISPGADSTSNEWVVWSNRQAGPYNPSTLLYEGRVYVLYDRGFLACFDARDGHTIYDRQRIPNGRAFTSSPWAYEGKIFCLNEDGVTFIIKAGDEFELLGENRFADDDMCMATPALADNRLLIRTAARLYCLREGATWKETIFASREPERVLSESAGEGPAWHPELGLFFSGNNRITRLAPDGRVETFREQAGANGLLIDRKANLLTCEPAQRRVTRTDLASGQITVLAEQYQGKRFNSPNDIAIDSQGRIYFSDPIYGPRDKAEMLDADGRIVEGVYRIDPDGAVTRIIAHDVDRPNGLVVSADDRFLFVADNNNNTRGGARKLWRFELTADGSVNMESQRCLFDWQTSRGPDGIELDQQGRLYVAAGLNKPQPPYETVEPYRAGVYVLTSEGQLLDFLPIETDEVTNCSFGGPNLQTLYVTAGGTLWRVPTVTAGRRSP